MTDARLERLLGLCAAPPGWLAIHARPVALGPEAEGTVWPHGRAWRAEPIAAFAWMEEAGDRRRRGRGAARIRPVIGGDGLTIDDAAIAVVTESELADAATRRELDALAERCRRAGLALMRDGEDRS